MVPSGKTTLQPVAGLRKMETNFAVERMELFYAMSNVVSLIKAFRIKLFQTSKTRSNRAKANGKVFLLINTSPTYQQCHFSWAYKTKVTFAQ